MAIYTGDVIIGNRYAPNLSHEFNEAIWDKESSLTSVRKRAYRMMSTRKKMGNGIKIYSEYGRPDPYLERKMRSIGVVFCRNGKLYWRKLLHNSMEAYVLNSDGTLGRKVSKGEVEPWHPSNYVYGL